MAIEELSLEDKGFMISHPQDFPREIKTMIYMNESQWMKKLEDYGKALFVKNKKFETLTNINKFVEGLGTTKEFISNKLMTLYNMPAGTYEDLGLFLIEAGSAFSSQNSYENELQLARIIYKELFFNKLNANDICIRIDELIYDTLSIYKNGIPILLVDQIVSIRNEKVVAYLIYLLFKICKCEDITAKLSFIGFVGNVYSLDKAKILEFFNDLDKGKTDEVRFLTDVDNLDTTITAKELAKNIIKNNKNSFFKDRSIYTKNNMSIVSDSIKLKDSFYFDLKKLVTEDIRSYFEDDDIIEYNGFSESDIGYLIKKEGFSISKTYIENSNYGMMTIASKDGTDFLLFRLNGRHDIYGISIQEKEDKERKLVMIEVPNDPLFQLQSNSLILL